MLATNVYGRHRKCIKHLFESDKKSYEILAINFDNFYRQAVSASNNTSAEPFIYHSHRRIR
jgi:hypothetical protein